ncbi:MAG: DUF3108 domain-containing protein [Gammaproteobacteria bacterium]|nr:DUF3108 domain-containing protein [Gammaproteobacteria bacterium]
MSGWVNTLLLVSTLVCSQAVLASELQPYEAVYKTSASGFKVNVKRLLEVDGSRITISNSAKRFFFSMRESSVLKLHDDGHLSALTHEHKRRGTGRKHDKELVFDWRDNTVQDLLKPERSPLAVENPTYDKLSYQTRMRLDLIRNPDLHHREYRVTNGVRNRVYSFERLGEEILETPLGDLRTIKFKREGGDDDRKVSVWVAPDWDYILVRIDQTKEQGGKTERMLLKSARIAGKQVVGLPLQTD